MDGGRLDIDLIISKILGARNSSKCLKNFLFEDEIKELCLVATEIFLTEPSLLEIEAPVKVASNIHGHFDELLDIFDVCGYPGESRYLFLGDYVDKGRQSLECICLLLAFKIKFRDQVFILRGNHECSSTNRIYGFYDECKTRYNVKLWTHFARCFNALPFAAVIEDKVFCVHGGLSPELKSVEKIKQIKRPTDIPDSGLICDLLWGELDLNLEYWDSNSVGASYSFGHMLIKHFLSSNNFSLLIIASKFQFSGYDYSPSIQTLQLFSIPNYCQTLQNIGAVLSIDTFLSFSFHIFKPKKIPNTKTNTLEPVKNNELPEIE